MSGKEGFPFSFEDMFKDAFGIDLEDVPEDLRSSADPRNVFPEFLGSSTKKGRGLGKATVELREHILEALRDVDKPVTVRQAYYLLTTRDAVDKTEAGYRKVQRQIVMMRREEEIPYNWIADNTRWMRKPKSYNGLADALQHSASFYRQNVWRDLPSYVEVWCEKDALAGVLFEETAEWDVPLMVARGYSSESFAFEAAENMGKEILNDKWCYVFYLGDLDPSGWQASIDLEKRLREFLGSLEGGLQFERLAVTPKQIREWKLPTRPSKKSDTRHKAFEQEFGKGAESVELDAIHPDDLRSLVRDAIERHVPAETLEAIRREEAAARDTLEEIAERWAA